ncbi:uncharacterized protein MONBRDRAFT_38707 [Monosiga brevicollis MX1]|uniref:Uncharacterized protein n=1 Tax=Monosiga brevicollis TaxID=81824 RepID=A9V9N1_MONBE|nr:uncharacterized protein MONBRDRAFT_38707 [Monosiga brevicollis MX1]EDQ85698.1 predicted protein [Monosiga brevicollis MX1]|eukprot:XP_001749413.1 hypothetical protein [Monosiga brevicollis MX1]
MARLGLLLAATLLVVAGTNAEVLNSVQEMIEPPFNPPARRSEISLVVDPDDFIPDDQWPETDGLDESSHRQRRDTYGLGDTIPANTTAVDVVGGLRDFFRPGSNEFDALLVDAEAGQSTIHFADENVAQGSYPHLMSANLKAVLDRMAAHEAYQTLLDAGIKFHVSKAYEAPPLDAPTNSENLHYEGRTLDLKFWRNNQVGMYPSLIDTVMQLAWISGADFVRNGDARIELAVVPNSCGAVLDVVFALDGSASLDGSYQQSGGHVDLWDKQIQFVKDVTSYFSVSSEETRVGVMSFHGPLLSHYSYVEGIPDCPQRSIWTFEGSHCVCYPDIGCTGPDSTCLEVDFAITPNGCENRSAGDYQQGKCEIRHAFPINCDSCECVGGPIIYPNASWTLYQDLIETTDQYALNDLLDNVEFPAGATHLSWGLDFIDREMFRLAAGMRSSNNSIPRVLIVLTDGRSNPGFEPDEYSTALKDKGIEIYAIGVGDYYSIEVQEMASEPKDRHAFELSNQDDLARLVDRLSYQTCSIPALLEVAERRTVYLDANDYIYYRGQCSVGSQYIANNVIVELQGKGGRTDAFVDSSTPQPGQFRHALAIDAGLNEFDYGLHSRIVDNAVAPVYIALRGSSSAPSSVADVRFYNLLFSAFEVNATLLEGASAGTEVLAAPSMVAIAGSIPTYSFQLDSTINGDGKFSIDSAGRIFVQQGGSALDRETKSTYKIKLWAYHSDNRCLVSYQLITIHLTDVDDTAPVFEPSTYTLDLQETTVNHRSRRSVNEVVLRLSATDADGSSVLTYSFTDSASQSQTILGLNSSSGELTQLVELDYESVDLTSFTLKVTATDSAGQESDPPATINVNIIDGDDSPFFDGLVEGWVTPTLPIYVSSSFGSFHSVPVIDDEKVEFQQDFGCRIQSYTGPASVTSANFGIRTESASCAVDVAETIPAAALGSNIRLTIELYDRQNTGVVFDSAILNMTVLRANIYGPQFDQETYTRRISVVEPVGSLVLDPLVTDADSESFTCHIASIPNTWRSSVAFGSDCKLYVTGLIPLPTSPTSTASILMYASDGAHNSTFATLVLIPYMGCYFAADDTCDDTIYACAGNVVNASTCSCATAEAVPGTNCDGDGIDYCEAADCQYDTNCEEMIGYGGATCDCPVGFSGPRCEVPPTDPCADKNCVNGECVPKRTGDFSLDIDNDADCACEDGWMGELCNETDTSPDPCLNNECQNGATCIREAPTAGEAKTEYSCQCVEGTSGDYCELNRGECDPAGQCTTGDCATSFCRGGTCVADAFNGTCSCPDGTKGEICDEEDESEDLCDPNPCLNGGTCVRVSSDRFGGLDSFVCECVAGRTGLLCEMTEGECARCPTDQGAICVPAVGDAPVCSCPSDLTSRLCDTDYEKCGTDFCPEGSFCMPSDNGGYCACPGNFSLSGQDDSRCSSNDDCQTEGFCPDGVVCLPSPAGGQCNCPEGYSGRQCQLSTLNCSSCPGNQQCEASASGGVCACPVVNGLCAYDDDCIQRVNCSDASTSSASKSAMADGTLVGIIIAALFAVILLIVLIWYLCCRPGGLCAAAKTQPEQPTYEAVEEQQHFSNPTFASPGAVNHMGVDAVDNPFYGVSAMADTYGSNNTYDGSATLRSNSNLQMEAGRLRLASVSRHNPLSGEESSTDPTMDAASNPMYGLSQDAMAQGSTYGATSRMSSNPGYLEQGANYDSASGPSARYAPNPGYNDVGGDTYDVATPGGGQAAYDSASGTPMTYGSTGAAVAGQAVAMPSSSSKSPYDSASNHANAGGYDRASQNKAGYDSAARQSAGAYDSAAPGGAATMGSAGSVNRGAFASSSQQSSAAYDSARGGAQGNPYDSAASGAGAYDRAATSGGYDSAAPGSGAYDTAAGSQAAFGFSSAQAGAASSGQVAGAQQLSPYDMAGSSNSHGYDTAAAQNSNYDTAAPQISRSGKPAYDTAAAARGMPTASAYDSAAAYDRAAGSNGYDVAAPSDPAYDRGTAPASSGYDTAVRDTTYDRA